MSGFFGHAIYAALAAGEAERRTLDCAKVARRHWRAWQGKTAGT
jgi:hypothetical protein